ncbi:uncharacterized protein LOC131018661 [Salvia miltiorrhiza]|uniref:uncharacterized protein LOC131018661 n=1 Tax=Salvia miltiorrhiza TaxID=226208 RepID=UPI0025AB6D45|nr:uncharacterized protein LOC131018661 [Salvia miltiorrhiza]
MSSGPGGVGGMKRVRLLQSLKQSKASNTESGRKTSVNDPHDDGVESNSLSRKQLMLIQILTPEAMARLFQIALDDPEMAKNMENSILFANHKGKIVGKVDEDRLISWLEQVKAQTGQTTTKGTKSNETIMTHKQNMDETFYTQDSSKSLGLRSSKRRIFGSPSCQVQSPMKDSHRLEKAPDKASTHGPKQGRGPASGQKLDQQVKKHGKYKILFLPGETDAVKFNLDLSNGIGIIVRTDAEIKGATGWGDVSEDNKAICYTRLFEWFEIEDWSDKRVQEIINAKFKSAFTRWRCTLHKLYENLLAKDVDPRDVCPRPDLTMEKWLEACDFIEDNDFQRKSRVNSENRKKKPFNHTSGKRTMLSHYKEMTEKSEIELFRKTHVSKSRGGEFINTVAQSKYNEMVDLKMKAAEHGKESLAEPVIVKSVLGYRSGYIKGMGHGVQVLHNRESNVFAGIDLKEKLLELESAKVEIVNLTKAYSEQRKKMDKMESDMAKMQGILQHIADGHEARAREDCKRDS